MKTEIYNEKGRYENPIIIEAGEDGDYFWLVISLGSHPCAYVGVKAEHPLFGIDYDEMYEKDIAIDVHGGVTYTSREVIGMGLDRWWIGWDYAHSGDYTAFSSEISESYKKLRRHERKWTLKEIKEDVKDVIKQLRKEGEKQ